MVLKDLYRKFYMGVAFYILRKRPTTALLGSRVLSKFFERSDKFLDKYARVLKSQVKKNGGSVSDDDVAMFKENFRIRETKTLISLETYKDADVSFEVKIPKWRQEEGVPVIVGESTTDVRVLKGLRSYDKQAEFLAREQVDKSFSEINNEKIRESSNKFRWWTKKDERVRGEHRLWHGKVFSWLDLPINDKGIRVEPGQEYGCRCVAKKA